MSDLSKAAFPLAGTEASGTRTGDPASEAMAALLALGYTGTEAQQALQKAYKRGENLNTEEIIRRARRHWRNGKEIKWRKNNFRPFSSR